MSENKVEEPTEQVSVPAGSEKVIRIRRIGPSDEQTVPLTVNTNYPTETRYAEMQVHTRREYSKKLSKHESPGYRVTLRHNDHQRRSPQHSPRRQQIWSTVVPSTNAENGERVVSCLEVEVPVSAKATNQVPIQHEREYRAYQPTQRSHKKSRQLSYEAWSPSRENYVDGQKWRYSEIFAPNSSKPNQIRVRKPRYAIPPTSVVPTTPATPWNTFFPFPVGYYPAYPPAACPRCSAYDMFQPPKRSISHEGMIGHNPHVVNGCCCPPYSAVSMENLSPAIRTGYFTPHPHQHYHHRHIHTDRYKNASKPLRMSTQNMTADMSYEDAEATDMDGFDGVGDVMEIEYAVVRNDDEEMVTSQRTLKQIVKLTKQYCIPSQPLKEQAKRLKLALDARYDEKWHVVIGDDSFGSDLACLPGTFANFRIDERVFLVWRT